MLEVSELAARAANALGMSAVRVQEPPDAAATARLLSEACLAGHAVTAWGGGTEQALGAPPERCDLVVSTARLHGIVAYAPEDLTIAVLGGTTLAEIADALGRHGQFLPIDVPYPERATVGGVVASAATPVRRLRYGGLRDLVIGLTVALPDGTLCTAGGRVVKNVAGYDLCKLFTGSLGTLGIIVSVNFKVQPLPHRRVVVQGTFADSAGALAAAAALAAVGSGYSALLVERNEPTNGCTLSVLVEGFASAMDAQVTLARNAIATRDGVASIVAHDDVPTLISRLAAWRADGDTPSATVLRISVLPARLGAALAALSLVADRVNLGYQWQADAALGTLFTRFAHGESTIPDLRGAIAELRLALTPLGGHVVIVRAPAALRRSIDPWAAPPELERLSRTIKAQLDPSRIMNPGRFAYGI